MDALGAMPEAEDMVGAGAELMQGHGLRQEVVTQVDW